MYKSYVQSHVQNMKFNEILYKTKWISLLFIANIKNYSK